MSAVCTFFVWEYYEHTEEPVSAAPSFSGSLVSLGWGARRAGLQRVEFKDSLTVEFKDSLMNSMTL